MGSDEEQKGNCESLKEKKKNWRERAELSSDG